MFSHASHPQSHSTSAALQDRWDESCSAQMHAADADACKEAQKCKTQMQAGQKAQIGVQGFKHVLCHFANWFACTRARLLFTCAPAHAGSAAGSGVKLAQDVALHAAAAVGAQGQVTLAQQQLVQGAHSARCPHGASVVCLGFCQHITHIVAASFSSLVSTQALLWCAAHGRAGTCAPSRPARPPPAGEPKRKVEDAALGWPYEVLRDPPVSTARSRSSGEHCCAGAMTGGPGIGTAGVAAAAGPGARLGRPKRLAAYGARRTDRAPMDIYVKESLEGTGSRWIPGFTLSLLKFSSPCGSHVIYPWERV